MDYAKFIVSNQKEESISIQRVNKIQIASKHRAVSWISGLDFYTVLGISLSLLLIQVGWLSVTDRHMYIQSTDKQLQSNLSRNYVIQ